MDFWEAQKRARRQTRLYLLLFAILTLLGAALIEYGLRYFDPQDYSFPYPLAGAFFVGITFLVAGFQYLLLKSGGGAYVAETVGGVLVPPDTRDFKLQQLLNIVKEVSIASAQPVPPVYILKSQEINAFAAGINPEDAVMAVTIGSLEKLSREELQGVIAHEFSHIANQDMKISLRLAAMVMGFYFLLFFGLRILFFTGGISQGDKRRGMPIQLIALLLLAAGIFTWFFGKILQSMVSRQREYLADASAVQYTRNPDGIAGALRKIMKDETHDMPSSGMAFSHLYFNHGSFFSNLFATHPPLEKRIEAIEGKTFSE